MSATTATTSPIRIAICGGGMGGLVTALSLIHFFPLDASQSTVVELVIYERSRQVGEVGAGLGIWPRVWDGVLSKLNTSLPTSITDDLKRYNPSGDADFDYYFLGELLFKADMAQRTGGRPRSFHRVDFVNVLVKHLEASGRCQINCSKKLVEYRKLPDAQGIKMSFADGSEAECDILIGADGINSAVRKMVLGGPQAQGADMIFSGFTVYRSVIKPDQLPADHYARYGLRLSLGKGIMVLSFPIEHTNESGSTETVINVSTYDAQFEREGTKWEGSLAYPLADSSEVQEMLRRKDMSGDEALVRLVEAVEKPMKWAVCTVGPLDSFVGPGEDNTVCLIGDAAHAMTPFQGAGAVSAMEDGYMLSALLSNAILSSGESATREEILTKRVPAAMRAYDSIRRPFVTKVQARARMSGRVTTLQEVDAKGNSEAVRDNVNRRTAELGTWGTKDLPAEQIENGLKMMKEELGSL